MCKTIAIITARGGSKRIPKKNIRDFCGKPIICYSIEAAIKSQMFDEVMVNADLAISAAGTTLYELAASGTPTIGYSLVDNQLENLMTFAEEGYIESVGDIRAGFPTEKILGKLEKLADVKVRSVMSRRMKELVDGNGSSRLAKEILNLFECEK